MQIAYKIYPALRNRMPEPWLKEIDRASKVTPGPNTKDYVQWQRGGTTKTPLPLMKSWVDTTAHRKDTWLVLVFHGIDGMGYEALSSTMLDEYFHYIRSKEDHLWVATFGDVTRYIREREASKVATNNRGDKITVSLNHPLDKGMYYLPLTLKTYVPSGWKNVKATQGKQTHQLQVKNDDKGSYVLYQAEPNGVNIVLAKV